MPAEKQFNQDKALELAMNLFWKKGYSATSIADLTKQLNIGKGSLYDTFHSKRKLFERAMTFYRKVSIERLESILQAEEDVKVGIKKICYSNVERRFADKERKGCLVANTCSELGNMDREMRDTIAEHNKEVQTLLSTYIEGAALPKGVAANQLADVFLSFLIGISQEIKYKKDKNEVLKSVDTLLLLIG